MTAPTAAPFSPKALKARAASLPADALLHRHATRGDFTDCFVLELAGKVTQAQFVEAFYTSWLFKLERHLLRFLTLKPSTDIQAGELAGGQRDQFAAWTVERRESDQILLNDFSGRTSSWLMAKPSLASGSTELYFGSSVTRPKNPRTGKAELGWAFESFMGLHELYSRHLLQAAARRLLKRTQLV